MSSMLGVDAGKRAVNGTAGDFCSLPAPDLSDRLAMIRRDFAPLVVARHELEDGLAVEFDRNAEIERRLEELVDFERGCCGGLDWELERTAEDRIRLSIRGLAPDAELLNQLGLA